MLMNSRIHNPHGQHKHLLPMRATLSPICPHYRNAANTIMSHSTSLKETTQKQNPNISARVERTPLPAPQLRHNLISRQLYASHEDLKHPHHHVEKSPPFGKPSESLVCPPLSSQQQPQHTQPGGTEKSQAAFKLL